MNAWFTCCSLVIALVAGANLVQLVQRTPSPSHAPTPRSNDVVVRHEERVRRVVAALRAHGATGPIGYVTDVAPAELPGDWRAMQDYFMTPFALAPWILEARYAECRWVIGNFKTAAAQRVPPDFEVVENFGAGLLLLRRKAP